MKKISYLLFASVAVFSLSCGKGRTTGDINVTLSVLQGETADMTGIKVYLHSSAMFDMPLQNAEATGTPTARSVQFVDLEPRKYYVCAWLDKDNDALYSKDDLYGFYPYPINLLAKDVKEVAIEVYVLD